MKSKMLACCWERGRPVRTANEVRSCPLSDVNYKYDQMSFALRAQCGRDVRAPSNNSAPAQVDPDRFHNDTQKTKENHSMNPRLEEVLNYLDSERRELREAVELVPAELREQQRGA